MALTDDGGGIPATMLVGPTGYAGNAGGGFGNGFGGDGWWILLLLLAFGGGWGMGGFGGGMWGMDGLYPWLNNSQNINGGFRDQMLQTSLGAIQNGITSGFGDVQNSLCSGFAGVNAAITNSQMANMQSIFGVQSALQNCCCENRANIDDLKYVVATENCADRAAASENTRDIIEAQTRGTQAILDKLCALELDSVKGQLAAAQRENVALQNAVNIATMRESQTAQTAQILAGQTAEVDALYNRLSNCPVPSTPVYGRHPIFTCGNNGCGCGGVA